jgi:acetolactate synthase-1/2/3 large subunit
MLGSNVATLLEQRPYELAVQGLGGRGYFLDDPELAADTLQNAQAAARAGQPVLVNALIGSSDFRKGSISM